MKNKYVFKKKHILMEVYKCYVDLKNFPSINKMI